MMMMTNQNAVAMSSSKAKIDRRQKEGNFQHDDSYIREELVFINVY